MALAVVVVCFEYSYTNMVLQAAFKVLIVLWKGADGPSAEKYTPVGIAFNFEG